jgi:hypothetical protein
MDRRNPKDWDSTFTKQSLQQKENVSFWPEGNATEPYQPPSAYLQRWAEQLKRWGMIKGVGYFWRFEIPIVRLCLTDMKERSKKGTPVDCSVGYQLVEQLRQIWQDAYQQTTCIDNESIESFRQAEQEKCDTDPIWFSLMNPEDSPPPKHRKDDEIRAQIETRLIYAAAGQIAETLENTLEPYRSDP